MNKKTAAALCLVLSLSFLSAGANAALVRTDSQAASFFTGLSMSRTSGAFVVDTFGSTENLPPAPNWSANGSVGDSAGGNSDLWASGAGSASYSNDSYTLNGSVKASGEWFTVANDTQNAAARLSVITDVFVGLETVSIEGIFDSFSAAQIDPDIPTDSENSLGQTIFTLKLYKKIGQGFADTGLIDLITPGTPFSQTLFLDPGLYRLEAAIEAGVSGRGFDGAFGWGGGSMDVTITDVSTVPLPAAAWLFGSGLLGLIGVARQGRRIHATEALSMASRR